LIRSRLRESPWFLGKAGSEHTKLRAGCRGVRQAVWRDSRRQFYRHHDRWRNSALGAAPGSSLLLPGNRDNQVPDSARALESVHCERRQRKVPAQLFQLGRGPGLIRSRELLLPKSDRSAGFVFRNFAIQTAERVGATLAQEFVLGRFTHRGGHIKRASPSRPPSIIPFHRTWGTDSQQVAVYLNLFCDSLDSHYSSGMMRRIMFFPLSLLACMCCTPIFAQDRVALDRLLAARAQYYTPTASGLKSFHCEATIDW